MKHNRFTRDVQTGENTIRAVNDHMALFPRHHAAIANSIAQRHLEVSVKLNELENSIQHLSWNVKKMSECVDDANDIVNAVNTSGFVAMANAAQMAGNIVSQDLK